MVCWSSDWHSLTRLNRSLPFSASSFWVGSDLFESLAGSLCLFEWHHHFDDANPTNTKGRMMFMSPASCRIAVVFTNIHLEWLVGFLVFKGVATTNQFSYLSSDGDTPLGWNHFTQLRIHGEPFRYLDGAVLGCAVGVSSPWLPYKR